MWGIPLNSPVGQGMGQEEERGREECCHRSWSATEDRRRQWQRERRGKGRLGERGPNKKLPPLPLPLSRSSSSVVVFLLFLLHPSTPFISLPPPPPTHVNNTLPLPLRLTTTPSSYYLPSPRLQRKKRYCHLTHSFSYHYEWLLSGLRNERKRVDENRVKGGERTVWVIRGREIEDENTYW